MALSAFTGRKHPPTQEDLQSSLGKAHSAWVKLLAMLADRIGPVDEVWAYSSATTGWGLRVRKKERIIVYMTPQKNQFLVSFALGEKAVAAARGAKLPAAILSVIDSAPRYAEGRGVRFEVKGSRDLPSLAKLAAIKSHS